MRQCLFPFSGKTSLVFLISSHPEKTFPDENTQLPAIIYGQKPIEKGFLARASCGPLSVDFVDLRR